VSKEISIPIASDIRSTSASLSLLRQAGIVVAGSVLLAVCAHIAVPLFFTPVPLTLQPFAVLLLGLLLAPRMAAATHIIYLLEGAAGLPVFAPSPLPGMAHLFGPTGGYLLAYPIAAVMISLLYRRMRRGFGSALVSAALGDLLILLSGAAWLAISTHARVEFVLAQSIAPFLPGDALKVAAAAGIAMGVFRLRTQGTASPEHA
jgi:biotin transport system substrate-specific component